MADKTTFEKYIFLLEEFEKRADKTLDAYDDFLLEEFGSINKKTSEFKSLSFKQLGRMLDELDKYFDNIEKNKMGKRWSYKLIKPIDILKEAFENSHELGWLFQMAHEGDPEVFKDLEQFTKKDKHIYKFKNTPFEDIENLEQKETFKRLKIAVEHREYRKIKFFYEECEHDNLKCLKLIFMDNNWYIAYVDEENMLKFGRISFIEEVSYAKKMGSFQPSSVQKQVKFLDSVQNSMSLYGIKPKTAIIKATADVAKYFEKDMKKFLSTQKYIKTLKDGSVMFSINYTQELEVLPFIQKWLPDLVIQEPQELKDAYLKKLTDTINNHS